MKDFKTLPKMKCGGKVKKMQAGGTTVDNDILERINSGKLKPVPMPTLRSNPEGIDIPGYGRAKPVEMPTGLNRGEGIDVPGYGRIKPVATPRTRGDAMLLKKGGKAKKKK
jgi:hypothetical protein